jgi:hypothetical protein
MVAQLPSASIFTLTDRFFDGLQLRLRGVNSHDLSEVNLRLGTRHPTVEDGILTQGLDMLNKGEGGFLDRDLVSTFPEYQLVGDRDGQQREFQAYARAWILLLPGNS